LAVEPDAPDDRAVRPDRLAVDFLNSPFHPAQPFAQPGRILVQREKCMKLSTAHPGRLSGFGETSDLCETTVAAGAARAR
jgi:hypothetical protein